MDESNALEWALVNYCNTTLYAGWNALIAIFSERRLTFLRRENKLNLQRKADDRRFLNTTAINILLTESWYQHRVDIDGQEVTLHIFDTAGKVSLPLCLSK